MAAGAAKDLLKATVAAADPAARTVDQLCDHFLAVRGAQDSRTREATVAGYRRELDRLVRPFFGAMAVAAVTPETVDEWKARYAAEGKARTRQKRVNLLASLFRLAVEEGWRGTNPVLKRHRVPVLKEGQQDGKLVGDQRVARVLSAAELTDVVERLDPEDPALRLVVELTGRVGLRLREVTHLRVEDVRGRPL